MEKVTRATFLFMKAKAPKKKFAQCETCIHLNPEADECELHRPQDDIDEDDSCGLYAHGTPAGGKPMSIVTPKESGLVSRQVRCENCAFFDPNSEDEPHCDFYTQLNLILPKVFDLDRYVGPQDCCNAQTPGARNPKVFGPFGPIKHGAGKDDDDGVKDGAKAVMDKALKSQT
jgi:hypothetical protein